MRRVVVRPAAFIVPEAGGAVVLGCLASGALAGLMRCGILVRPVVPVAPNVAVPLFSAASRAALSAFSWVASSFDVNVPDVLGVVVAVVAGVAAPAENRLGPRAPPTANAAIRAAPKNGFCNRFMLSFRWRRHATKRA